MFAWHQRLVYRWHVCITQHISYPTYQLCFAIVRHQCLVRRRRVSAHTSMYASIHITIHACMYIYASASISMHTSMRTHMHMHIYIRARVCTFAPRYMPIPHGHAYTHTYLPCQCTCLAWGTCLHKQPRTCSHNQPCTCLYTCLDVGGYPHAAFLYLFLHTRHNTLVAGAAPARFPSLVAA